MSLLDRFFQKDGVALSKVISYIENQEPGYQKLLGRLYPHAGKAYKIGITGPPGAGKSTIADRISSELAAGEKELGIIAVDPTSPFTGGALLGDRIRMQDLSLLPNVFIRSMATRGSTGGLAQTTSEVTLVLDAFGKEYILIETVGVGQAELDVADLCDTTVVVLVPEFGDSVQVMKAGLMEIGDIFVVNKSDRLGAGRLLSELEMVLEIRGHQDGWGIPVVATEAVNNVGTEALLEKITQHQSYISSHPVYEKHRKNQIRTELSRIVSRQFQELMFTRLLPSGRLESLIEEIYRGEKDPYSSGREVFSRIEVRDN